MQFVGHTRFSVYSHQSDKFAATRGKTDEEAYLGWLYATERLAPRTEIFIEESLPQIARARKVHEVSHVVCYSSSLPASYRAALEKADKEYDFLRLYVVDEPVSGFAPPTDAIRQSVQWKPGSRQRVGIYRLDDDDLVAEDYFDRMANYADVAEPGWRISLGLGYSAIRSKGHYYFSRQDHHPMASVGMLSIVELTPEGSVMGLHDTAHQRSDTGGPVLVDSTEVAFFRTRHPGQDNIMARFKGQDFLSSTVAEMRRWNPALPDEVVRQFPVLKGRVNEEVGPDNKTVELLTESTVIKSNRIGFEAPFSSGCMFQLDIEGRFNPGELIMEYKLLSRSGARTDDDLMRKDMEAKLIRYSSDSGYHEPIPANERGSFRHLVIRCPDGLELVGFDLVSRKNKPVTVHSVKVFPLLSTETAHP